MRVGVIAALYGETVSFSHRSCSFLNKHELIVKVSGPGYENATHAAQELLAEGTEILVSWGLAGGLDPSMMPAQIVVGSTVISANGDTLKSDDLIGNRLMDVLSDLQPIKGPIYTSTYPVSSAAEKSKLHSTHAAIAVDMESAAIAHVAREANAKFAAIRCIIDPSEFDLPPAAEKGIRANGRLNTMLILGHLLKQPWDIGQLIRLANWYRAALRKLDQTARLLTS